MTLTSVKNNSNEFCNCETITLHEHSTIVIHKTYKLTLPQRTQNVQKSSQKRHTPGVSTSANVLKHSGQFGKTILLALLTSKSGTSFDIPIETLRARGHSTPHCLHTLVKQTCVSSCCQSSSVACSKNRFHQRLGEIGRQSQTHQAAHFTRCHRRAATDGAQFCGVLSKTEDPFDDGSTAPDADVTSSLHSGWHSNTNCSPPQR